MPVIKHSKLPFLILAIAAFAALYPIVDKSSSSELDTHQTKHLKAKVLANSTQHDLLASTPKNFVAAPSPELLTTVPTPENSRQLQFGQLEVVLKNGGYQEVDINGNPVSSDYHSYSNSALNILSENGDVTAMQLLGNRLMTQGDLQQAQTHLWKASVYGQTKSLLDLAAIKRISTNEEESADTVTKGKLEAYSLINLAIKRGDILAQSMLPIYQQSLTSEQLKIADEQTDQLFAELTQQRSLLGLGDWENN